MLFSVMSAAGDGGHLFIDDIYAVIAAVEDWYLGQETRSPLDVMGVIVEAEHSAAIQRVRDLCEDKTREVTASDPLFGPPLTLYVDDILRALNGGAE